MEGERRKGKKKEREQRGMTEREGGERWSGILLEGKGEE
jgi:hypothetical protein